MMKFISKRICCPAVVFGLLLGCMVLVFLYMKLPTYTVKKSPDRKTEVAADLMNVKNIEQSFEAEDNNLAGIKIKLSVGPSELTRRGIFKFELFDEKGAVLSSQIVKVTLASNEKSMEIHLPCIENSKGRQFTIRLSAVQTENNERVLFYSEKSQNNTAGFIINGQKSDRPLAFDAVYKSSRFKALYNGRYSSAWITMIICISTVAVFAGSILLCKLLFIPGRKI